MELDHLREGKFQEERMVCELTIVQQQIERAACIVQAAQDVWKVGTPMSWFLFRLDEV